MVKHVTEWTVERVIWSNGETKCRMNGKKNGRTVEEGNVQPW